MTPSIHVLANLFAFPVLFSEYCRRKHKIQGPPSPSDVTYPNQNKENIRHIPTNASLMYFPVV
jgi:hypothetical protein